jgi:superkiller protein 3
MLNPDNGYAWNNLGRILYLLGRMNEAQNALKNATITKPEFDQGWYNYGNVLYASGAYNESMTAYKKAVELNPENEIAKENLKILESQ